MHHDDRLSLQRIDRLRRERIEPARYRATAPLRITSWEVPGEPVPFSTAVSQEYSPFELGAPWGRPWGTVWFRLDGEVPADWEVGEATAPVLVVDLGFTPSTLPGFQAEGLVYRLDGSTVKAIEPRNTEVRLSPGRVELLLEAASNPNVAGDFSYTPTTLGDLATAGDAKLYRLRRLELALLDTRVWELDQDFAVLRGLVDVLDPSRSRRARIIEALLRALDVLDPDDVAGSAGAARAVLADVLATPAEASAHRIAAVGHSHIDSAWLWPVRETVRKVARTFSNVLELLETHPEFVFAASSAQQFAWLKEHHPHVFARVADAVRGGRFVPVGGMWVESDTNMPGGEALARQLIIGKRFFMEELGVEPLEVWLPDSFGYSAALPQIIAAAGSRWFLTQKISWNETNRMPHHSFLWEGLDGTRVFTHFPPVDSYNSDLSPADLARAEQQFADKRRADLSLVPFGWGDGGGGPTREMLASAARSADLEGSPKVTITTPQDFFEEAETEYPDAPVWSGELYLEYHRGSFSAQARTKWWNRRLEHLLREAELWSALATVRTGARYPSEELESAWRVALLHQFHDILPGTSIAWVHREAERRSAEIAAELEPIISRALSALAGPGSTPITINSAPTTMADVPPLSGIIVDSTPDRPTPKPDGNGGFSLDHDRVRWHIDARGLVDSAFDLLADREVIPADSPGNLLQLQRDTPREWDAWNIDAEDGDLVTTLTDADDVAVSADGVGVRIRRTFGASTVEQDLRVDPASGALVITTDIDWHETRKLLKLAIPLSLAAPEYSSEIQFGHIVRPTHRNTSWDAARFETVAHRWITVDEGDYRVSIANDSSYGHDVHRPSGTDGGRTTVARVTLVRGPLFPDPSADRGDHRFRISVLPGASIDEAIAAGFSLNLPPRTISGGAPIDAAVVVDDPGIVVEAFKLAEDGSGDVIIRAYEALGSARRGSIRLGFAWSRVVETDLLEREVPARAVVSTERGSIDLELGRFQLVTLRVRR